MRSATFPPIRVEPEVRAEVEAVLREGETLTQFIEEAVVAAAAWLRTQAEFVKRGEEAIERWKREAGGRPADEVMTDLQSRLDSAKREAARRPGRDQSRELVIPFGATGCVVLFEVVGDEVVVGAVRRQREEDYRH